MHFQFIFFIIFLLSSSFFCLGIEEIYADKKQQFYSNPLTLDNEWEDYGIGDPFVLKFNGVYYLYVSTKDGNVGIKSWSSEDLINWKYEGTVTKEPKSITAYAPEVNYWNGKFYLITSPAGTGHYIFESDSPTGPFIRKSNNLGMSIDGTIFVDDDGQFYFAHAGANGIEIHKITNCFDFEEGKIINSAYLNGWTEGPQIIKINGNYYLTFCGNHVLSKGYRVHYAISKESPLCGYFQPSNNPLLISTVPNFNGLGHSCIVRGPNLASYYIIYHNLEKRSLKGWPIRHMNIDRVVFNGDLMYILGPTNFKQLSPQLPDFYDKFEEESSKDKWIISKSENNTSVISKQATKEAFTAEFNFNLSDYSSNDSTFSLLFSYVDENNYSVLEIKPYLQKIELLRIKEGKCVFSQIFTLPKTLDFSKLHCILIEKDSRSFRAYIDQMKIIEVNTNLFEQGKIGYLYHNVEPILGFTAFSNKTMNNSDNDFFNPIPGSIQAIHFSNEENISCDFILEEEGDYSLNVKEGTSLDYKINVSKGGLYALDMLVKVPTQITIFDVFLDNVLLGTYVIPSLQPKQNENLQKYKVTSFNLSEGFHKLTLKVNEGELYFKKLAFRLIPDEPFYNINLFENITMDDIYGTWYVDENGYYSTPTKEAIMFVGESIWDNYKASIDVKLPSKENDGEGSLLFRLTNESYHPSQAIDSFTGYSLVVNNSSLQLRKHNYNTDILKTVEIALEPECYYHLEVEVINNEIKVYIDNQLVMSYFDPQVYMNGRLGICSKFSNVIFRNLVVSSIL